MSLPAVAPPSNGEAPAPDAGTGAALSDARAGPAAPIAYINHASQTADGLEIGPPVMIEDGPLRGPGTVVGEAGIRALFELIETLPLTDRARLMVNRFSATPLVVDIDGDGSRERVFISIEFPPSLDFARDRTNPLTGERERLIFEGGRWKRTVTGRRLTEFTAGDDLVERSTRTYVNEGTIDAPRPGTLLEETRTVEAWHRDWSAPEIDPGLPMISKIRVNYVTGISVKETYGLHPRPVESVGGDFITRFRIGPTGLVKGAEVFANGRVDEDFARPLIDRLLRPVEGELRFRLSAPPGVDLATVRDAGYQFELGREDVLKGLTKTLVIDLANGGRTLLERAAETLPGAGSISLETRYHYAEDFHFGLIPKRAETWSGTAGAGGTVVATTETLAFDPSTRRLTGREVSSTGGVRTLVWDARWEDPVESRTAARKTVISPGRRGLSWSSETASVGTGEVLYRSGASFDRGAQRWSVTRESWYSPGVPNRPENLILSPSGRLLTTRGGGSLETRLTYGGDGLPASARTVYRDGGGVELTVREEFAFRWEDGARRARVNTFLGGKLHERFATLTDAEGREVEDRAVEWPGLELKTVRRFDGASDRVERAETYHNGRVRATFRPGHPVERGDGTFELKVEVVPDWGRTRTEFYPLGGAALGWVRQVYENGAEVTVLERFPGTAVARRTRLTNPGSDFSEEAILSPLEEPVDGVPVDLVERYRVDPGGARQLLDRRALVRGGDIALYADDGEKRIYFSRDALEEAPRFEVDRSPGSGVTVVIDGVERTKVTRLFRAERTTWGDRGEDALRVRSIDLRGFFNALCQTRTYDLDGVVLGEQELRMPLGFSQEGAWTASDESLFGAAGSRPVEREVLYSFPARPPGAAKRRANRIRVRERRGGPARGYQEGFELVQEMVDPVRLTTNAYLPDHAGPWTSWRVVEGEDDGQARTVAEVIFDGRERPAVTVSPKQNARGEPGERVAYDLREPGGWTPSVLVAGANRVGLDLPGTADFSNCHFLVAAVRWGDRAGEFHLEVRDGAGRSRRVTAAGGGGDLVFWPGDGEQVQWIPRQAGARAAASVRADGAGTLLLSVPDLAAAGLDIRDLAGVTLVAQSPAGGTLARTPLRRLCATSTLEARAGEVSAGTRTILQSNGLQTVHSGPPTTVAPGAVDGRDGGGRADPYWNSDIRFQGLTVAKVRPRREASTYPVMVVQDPSGSEPTPLYALVAENGEFLEYYHRRKSGGDTRVYTVATGPRPPRAEIFRGGVLEDETAPGIVAVGDNYEVELPLSRTSRFHNRISSSIFKLAADRLEPLLPGTTGVVRSDHPDPLQLHRANVQAANIAGLPTLASALLPFRDVPWRNAGEEHHGDRSDGPFDPPAPAGEWFSESNFLTPQVPLFATAAGTAVAPFADTLEEARLIRAAIHAGQFAAAAAAIDFFWEKSRGGEEALHTSYERQTGASLHLEPHLKRPSQAPRTAAVQLAIAEVALAFAEATGDADALRLGSRLLGLLLAQFRSPHPGVGGARAIADDFFLARNEKLGFSLWPRPARYSLDTNARVYLALKKALVLGERTGIRPGGEPWRRRASGAVAELEDWLRNVVVPQVGPGGVVPAGLFEIQDMHGGTTAIGVSRWTSAPAWLSFLEAADEMGIPRERTRHWLEVLARVHGAEAGGVWGLDWSVALTRHEAVSPELTARFFKVARLLGHGGAAMFARAQLVALGAGEGEMLPVVLTDSPRDRRLPTGQGASLYPLSDGTGWPRSPAPYRHLTEAPGPAEAGIALIKAAPPGGLQDVGAFLWGVLAFYASVLAVAVLWWLLRASRGRPGAGGDGAGRVVSDAVMAAAERRWAERVVGVSVPGDAPNSRFANGPVEGNFIMQLRAIFKLVLEWRRLDNGWAEDDPELAGTESDPWLNGMDEFAAMVALYMRYVVKAGLKDGFYREDVLDEAEDSNHIWSRLVLYFSEYYSGLLTLLDLYRVADTAKAKKELNQQIFLLLNAAGVRLRKEPFDGRRLYDCPADEGAFDLLIIQKPLVTLPEVVAAAEEHLAIPERHFRGFVRRYKVFKRREAPFPVHPFVLEAAKVLPHMLLVGLLGILWYNSEIAGLPILPFLAEAVGELAAPRSMLWAVPLAAGYALATVAYYLKFMRYEAGMRAAGTRPLHPLLFPLRRFIRKPNYILPLIKPGRRWDTTWYERVGYSFRGVGFLLVGVELLRLPAPSFAVFIILKGLLALMLIVEAAAVFVPLASAWLSMWLQFRARGRRPWRLTRFLNHLNIPATRPASVVWQAIVYHYQISVPSGSPSAFVRSVLFYFAFAAVFLLAGGYVAKEVFAGWFADTYRMGDDFRLVVGGLVFLNTMYLMRFGLYVMLSGAAAALATFPLKACVGLVAAGVAAGLLAGGGTADGPLAQPALAWSLAGIAVFLALFEGPVLRAFQAPFKARARRREEVREEALEAYRRDPSRTLGIVYMSGDDLGHRKLTPDLLMDRVEVLRERLGSSGVRGVTRLLGDPDDGELRACFTALYQMEAEAGTTLWHPAQLVVAGHEPAVPEDLGLNLTVADGAEKERLLGAWHARRWLVSMMSSAGHAQDTAINLVDIALRIAREGLAPRAVFYLIQNKYDGRDDNRPGQMDYGAAELGQREKLTRLLRWAAPGSRAFSLNDWTPFGFKAGGMMGMDLVHEEALKLTNMVVLDRNATVHDLDALMEDIYTALADPGVVNVIPGRGTTNTRTPIGQGSQSMEEGQRELMKGVMLIGGEAGESVGTGWGNIQAIYYGRTQRAMMDRDTRRLPLTTRMMRGSTFGDRLEGMVGFGPHAVGISEDIWAVIQAAHNAVSLGIRVKFKRSRAMWHKIRETWSHAEWFSAFPRWSGGFLQMMQDPLMQRISDSGPLSVFAKEIRANNGRFFLCAPFALLSILVMPVAIILDASPFVQILVVLWNFGFLMNQVLTSLGLVATLEATGYSRVAGLLGALAAGGGALAGGQLSAPACALATVAGALGGGFLAGLGRWLYDRGRDIILFGPQLVIFALGQLVRQSLEFVLSGASAEDAKGVNIAFRSVVGPREDRPLAGYVNPVNLRSVVWLVGGLSIALNLIALTNLDFLNVVLLLPSLLFGVSCLAGPFLMRPKRGLSLGFAGVVIPRVFAWFCAAAVLVLLAGMVARGGHHERAAFGLAALVIGWLAFWTLRYVRFPWQLRSARRALARELRAKGGDLLDAAVSVSLADHLVTIARDPAAVRDYLREFGFPGGASEGLGAYVEKRVAPILRHPAERAVAGPTRPARLRSEFRRSFAMATMTLMWFLIVPVPGLLTFTAGEYQVAFGVTPFVSALATLVGLVLAAALAGLLAERCFHLGPGRRGLNARAHSAYHRFRRQALTDPQVSALFALFTDFQTYLDQRAYAYAWRTLGQIEDQLGSGGVE